MNTTSIPNRRSLHLVGHHRPDLRQDLRMLLATGDSLLLLDEGLALLNDEHWLNSLPETVSCFALDHAGTHRVRPVDDTGFLQLCETHQPIVSWY